MRSTLFRRWNSPADQNGEKGGAWRAIIGIPEDVSTKRREYFLNGKAFRRRPIGGHSRPAGSSSSSSTWTGVETRLSVPFEIAAVATAVNALGRENFKGNLLEKLGELRCIGCLGLGPARY